MTMANDMPKNEMPKNVDQGPVIFAYRTGAKHDVMVRAVPKGEMPQPDDFVTFTHGYLETSDPKVIAALRAHKSNEKNNTKKPQSRCFRELSDIDARILREKIRTSRLPSRLHLRQLGVLNGEFQSLED